MLKCKTHLQGHWLIFLSKLKDLHSVPLRTLIADKGDSLVQCADFRSCLPSQDAPVSSGPLAVMQGRNLKYDSSV